MPSEEFRSAVFCDQPGTSIVDTAKSKSGFTALHDTRTDPHAGDFSSGEISAASQLSHENGPDVDGIPSKTITAPLNLTTAPFGTNSTISHIQLSAEAIRPSGLSKPTTAVQKSINMGQEETVMSKLLKKIVQNIAGNLQENFVGVSDHGKHTLCSNESKKCQKRAYCTIGSPCRTIQENQRRLRVQTYWSPLSMKLMLSPQGATQFRQNPINSLF